MFSPGFIGLLYIIRQGTSIGGYQLRSMFLFLTQTNLIMIQARRNDKSRIIYMCAAGFVDIVHLHDLVNLTCYYDIRRIRNNILGEFF